MCETNLPLISHYLIELGAYMILIILLWSAWKKGRFWVLTLLTGIFFGLILEALNMQVFHAYEYGTFLIVLPGQLPLAVGVGWGMIIYAAMLTSAALGVVWWIRPFMVGLLALMIDFTLDPIASQQGLCLWVWAPEQEAFVFGIPPRNFFSWFFVAFGFSLFWYILNRKFKLENQSLFKQVGALLIILILSMVFLFAAIISIRVTTQGALLSVLLILGAVLLISTLLIWRYARPIKRENPINLPVLLVPLYFYAYAILAILIWIRDPQMLLSTLSWAVLGTICYLLPYSKTISMRKLSPGN